MLRFRNTHQLLPLTYKKFKHTIHLHLSFSNYDILRKFSLNKSKKLFALKQARILDVLTLVWKCLRMQPYRFTSAIA